MDLDFKIKPGEVHINSITILRHEDNLLHFSIDCREKYSLFAGGGYDESDLTIDIIRNQYGSMIPIRNPTTITVKGFGGWRVLHSEGRYAIDVALVRMSDDWREHPKQFVFDEEQNNEDQA